MSQKPTSRTNESQKRQVVEASPSAANGLAMADPRRYMVIAAVLLLFGFVLALNYHRIQASGTWLHIKLGEEIVRAKSLTALSTFSGIESRREIVSTEWLAFVLFYLLDDGTGTPLTYLQLVIVGILAILVGRTYLKYYGTNLFTLGTLAVFAYLYSFRVEVRPELFGNAGILITAFLFDQWRRNPESKCMLWLWPTIALWANLHGSFSFVFVYLGGFAIAEALGHIPWIGSIATQIFGFTKEHLMPLGSLKRLALVLLGCLGAALVTPYGFALISHTFEIFFGYSFLKSHILEWQSIADVSSSNYWYWAWIGFLLTTWYTWFIHRSDSSPGEFAMLGMATLMPFSGMRHVAASSIILLPLLLRHGSKEKAWSLSPAIFILPIVPMILYVLTYGNPFSALEHKPLGTGFNMRQVPDDILSYIKTNGLKGKVMNHYEEGPYFSYYLYPDVKPVMDCRVDLHGEALYNEHRLAYYTLQNFRAFLAKYDVNLVMLKSISNFNVLRDDLMSDPQWTLAMIGRSHFLFVRTPK